MEATLDDSNVKIQFQNRSQSSFQKNAHKVVQRKVPTWMRFLWKYNWFRKINGWPLEVWSLCQGCSKASLKIEYGLCYHFPLGRGGSDTLFSTKKTKTKKEKRKHGLKTLDFS